MPSAVASYRLIHFLTLTLNGHCPFLSPNLLLYLCLNLDRNLYLNLSLSLTV